MAVATDTALGTVLLAGDLAGSSNANTPQLTPTGVTPGEYKGASVVVDAKGRILHARSFANFDVPCASSEICGLVKVTGDHNITSEDGKISVKLASETEYGVVKIGNGLGRDCCETFVEVTPANATTVGIVAAPSPQFTIQDAGDLAIVPASPATKGTVVVPVDGGLTVSNGTVSFAVSSSTATASSRGVVQVGNGLNVASGVLSFNGLAYTDYVDASTTSTGVVQIGSGLQVSGATVFIENATNSTLGKVSPGNILLTGQTISIPVATTSTIGGVKVGANLGVLGDGSLIRGVGVASTSNKGIVQMDADTIQYTGSAITMSKATSASAGIVRGDSTFTHTSGVLAYNRVASGAVFGFVKVGSGFDLALDGTISRPGFGETATKSTKGMVSVPTTTASGANAITVNAGVLALSEVATTTSKGKMQVGDHLDVVGGLISIPTGGASTAPIEYRRYGVVCGDSASVFSVNGALTAPNLLRASDAYTRTTRECLSSATGSLNGSFALNTIIQTHRLTITASSVWESPTGLIPGTIYRLYITGSSGSITLSSGWSWAKEISATSTFSMPASGRLFVKVLATSATTAVLYNF